MTAKSLYDYIEHDLLACAPLVLKHDLIAADLADKAILIMIFRIFGEFLPFP